MQAAQSANPVEKVCLSVEEARLAIGIGRELFYKQLNAGNIRSFKIGHRRFITRAALQEYIEKLDTDHNAA